MKPHANLKRTLFGGNDNGFYGLYKSTDEGQNWTLQSDSPNLLGWDFDGSDSGGQAWYDLALAVDPNNEQIVFVGGVNCWKSTKRNNIFIKKNKESSITFNEKNR